MERRYLSLDRLTATRAKADRPPMIAGHAARFYDPADPATEFELYADARTRVVERISPGAFARAVKEGDCRALFNHDPDHVLGRCSAGTLRLKEDKRGLHYEIDPPDTQLARDLMESIGRGDITGSSFSFNDDFEYTESRTADGRNLIVQHVRDADVYDVGPVTFPAYGGASAGVRAASVVDVAALLARIDRHFRADWSAEACQQATRARVRAMEAESR